MSTINDQSLLTECHLEALKQELGFRERIANFLEQTNLVAAVRRVCAEFYGQFLAEQNDRDLLLKPLIVRLPIRYDSLAKFDSDLLRKIIEEPIYFEQSLQEVVHSITNAYFAQVVEPNQSDLKPRPGSGPGFCVRLQQIFCRVRLQLPPRECYLFRAQPNNVNTGLTVFRCVVQGYSSLQKYILQSVWLCPDYPLTHIHLISGEIRRAPKCEDCGDSETVLQEHQRIRTVGDYYTVRAFSADTFRTPVRVGRIFQSISVRLADDLCVPVKLGHEYVITGVFNPPNLLFSAWSIEEV